MKVRKFELIHDYNLIPLIDGSEEYGPLEITVRLELVMRKDEYFDYADFPYTNHILKYRGLIYKFRPMDARSFYDRDEENIYIYEIEGRILPESFSDKEISNKELYPTISKCQE